ncbi:MAG: sulfotransferase family protein [Candidatus Solibacter sp.]
MDFLTIVSGLPRSGTSLMMQMLAAGGLPPLTDHLRTPDQDNPRGYLEFEPVKRTRQDASWVPAATGKCVKMVYLLLRDLPPGFTYRVILMRRDLTEVLASQAAMLERSGKQGGNLPPDRMLALYSGQLSQIVEWLARQPNFTLLEVQHRDCLYRSADTAAAINAFLGGTLDESLMAAAIDPALHRNRAGAR